MHKNRKIIRRVCCGLLISLLFLTSSFTMPSLTIVQAESLSTPDQTPANITHQEIEDLWANAEKREVEPDKSNDGSKAESVPTNEEADAKEHEDATTNEEADAKEHEDATAKSPADTAESPTTDRRPHINFKRFTARTKDPHYTKGIYPTRKGVILVTKDKFHNIIPLGHAAIIYGRDMVIEAFGDGVQYGKNDWNRSRKTAYGASVKKTTKFQDAQAAEWCKNQIGKPYNFNYLNIKTRDRFYCSQLIWAAYLDNYGINIDTPAWGCAIHPSEILNSDEVDIIYHQS